MITFLWAFLLSVFSSGVMTYITLVTPIGPWMGPTLALFSLIVCAPFAIQKKKMLLAVCAGSIGGIVATAVSFSFPTLYFLDKDFFTQLVATPFAFMSTLAALIAVGGYFGIYCAYRSSHALLEEQQLSFPIGHLVHKIIMAQQQTDKIKQLALGIFATIVYGLLQMKTFMGQQFIPAVVTVWNKRIFGYITVPHLTVDLTFAPMLLAIGFIAGNMITVPLLIGAFIKIVALDPFCKIIFPALSSSDCMFAFCSGIVLSGAIMSFFVMPVQLYQAVSKWWTQKKVRMESGLLQHVTVKRVVITSLLVGFFSWFEFSPLAQIYIIVATTLCAYKIAQIAGKIGLALLGRFATFIMVPGFLLFGFTPLQITIVATFVELSGGVATDALFGHKVAELAGIEKKELWYYQVFGLVVSACVVSVVFYFLVTHYQLGSEQLFAQRGQARALLIQAASFNYYILILGALFGMAFKKIKVNPMLVLGGLLMPLSLSLPLIIGGTLSAFVKDKQEYEPICSGVYAANAVMVLARIFFI